MTPLSHHPTGASLAGRYVISTRRHGGPRWGIYRGFSRCTRVAGGLLVTVSSPQTRTHDELVSSLTLPITGVAPLLHIGPVRGAPRELDGMVEREPAGAPLSEALLPLAPEVAFSLVRQIALVLAEIHERDVALGGLQPELIYARRTSRGGLELTEIVPRGPVFALTASDAGEQVTPFRTSYTPPESCAAGRGGPASDVFSLCALASHWLSGHHPFRAARTSMQMGALACGSRSPWSGPRAWGQLLDRGLSPDSADRPPLPELVHALDTF